MPYRSVGLSLGPSGSPFLDLFLYVHIVSMQKLKQALERLRDGPSKKEHVHEMSENLDNALFRSTVESIPPLPTDMITGQIKDWADAAGVVVGPVDGIWRYSGSTLADAQQGDGCIGLHFHGGGYVLGSTKDDRSGFARIPRGFVEQGICSCVLSIEYTMAIKWGDGEPPRSFPLQLLEALSAHNHLLTTLSIPPSRIVLIGDSAGAHLVLAFQRYLLEHGGPLPSPGGLVLLSPWCDLTKYTANLQGLLGPLTVQDLSTPYFSPSLHPPPPNWPPTLVYSGAKEKFAPSISALVSQLRGAQAPVTFYEAENILPHYSHDFLIFPSAEKAWPEDVRECWTRVRAWTTSLRSR
ncbi:alpha/beta-hydrolase [Trametes polyzona]|nr:alpha/beta-hydrolase [Trametes polyzona]